MFVELDAMVRVDCVFNMINKILISLVFVIITEAKYKGDVCEIESSKIKGVCKLLSECTPAINNLKQNIKPTHCGFEGIVPIVCCDNSFNESTITKIPDSFSNIREISKKKCNEYGTHVYKLIESPLLISPQKLNVSTCSRSAFPTFLNPLEKEFPHQIIIGYEYEQKINWICNGVLINENYALTTAQCANKPEKGKLKYVRIGYFYDQYHNEDKSQIFTIQKVIFHPNYKSPMIYNNVALIKLDKPVVINSNVRPICLQSENFEGKKVIATSYNITQFNEEKNANLHRLVLDVVSPETCYQNYIHQSIIFPNGLDQQLCVDKKNRICEAEFQGENGVILQIYHPDVYCMYYLVGISSIGNVCGKDKPLIFHRISNDIRWIENQIWG